MNWPPPERERVGSLRPEQEEAEDEPEVRRVEDVAAAMDDQVLGEERHGRGAGEDPPAVQAPPVAVLGAGDTEHEGDAVAGQERARRPHQHPLAAERDRDLEQGARAERDQDLGDGEVEVERGLPQDLECHDHAREMQPRVVQLRQQHRVGRAADAHGGSWATSAGALTGPPMVRRGSRAPELVEHGRVARKREHLLDEPVPQAKEEHLVEVEALPAPLP